MKTAFLPALLLSLAVLPLQSQERTARATGVRASDVGRVYAKIILPAKAPAKGEHPPVESWIARKLRKHGATEFRAVTAWVRLPEKGEGSAAIWDATLDGERRGCPVHGQVSERTADGTVRVTLSGWSPLAPKIKGDSLPAEIGSRGIAVVDTGRTDGLRSYVALMIAPARETRTGEQVVAPNGP